MSSTGTSSFSTPVYVSECSPSHLRGTLVTMLSLAMPLGAFVSTVVNGLLCGVANDWRYVFVD